MERIMSPTQIVAAHGHSVVPGTGYPVRIDYTRSAAIVKTEEIGPLIDGVVHLTIPTPVNMRPDSRLTRYDLELKTISGAEVTSVEIYFGSRKVFEGPSPGGPIQPSVPFEPGKGLGVTLNFPIRDKNQEIHISSASLTFETLGN
jgi:hypothetical protein